MASIPKLAKRLEHVFSKTYRALGEFVCVDHGALTRASISEAIEHVRRLPPVGEGEVHVLVMADTRGCGIDSKGNPAQMTEGNGLISENLAATFPKVSSGQVIDRADGAPLVTQYREYAFGSLDKGTLTTDSRLPPGWIVLPNSSRKITGGAGCAARARRFYRFEINNTGDEAHAGKLNVNLVQILERVPKSTQTRAAQTTAAARAARASRKSRRGRTSRRGSNVCVL